MFICFHDCVYVSLSVYSCSYVCSNDYSDVPLVLHVQLPCKCRFFVCICTYVRKQYKHSNFDYLKVLSKHMRQIKVTTPLALVKEIINFPALKYLRSLPPFFDGKRERLAAQCSALT